MAEEIDELTLPSRVEAVNDAAVAASEIARRAGFDDEAIFGIDLAVREALANAVLHGNEQDETKLVVVTFVQRERILEIVVRDEGCGFNPAELPDPTAPQNILKEHGRGILLMRALMDEVEFAPHAEGGTTVRMIKSMK